MGVDLWRVLRLGAMRVAPALITAAMVTSAARAQTAQGSEFQVNTYTTSVQTYPRVAAAANGDFIVVWQSDGSSGDDTSGFSIQGQRYSSSGAAQGSQFQVNTYTTNGQYSPSVA